MTVMILCAITSLASVGLSCYAIMTIRRMDRNEAAKDFTDREKGQIRQILNMMMFDGNPYEN